MDWLYSTRTLAPWMTDSMTMVDDWLRRTADEVALSAWKYHWMDWALDPGVTAHDSTATELISIREMS